MLSGYRFKQPQAAARLPESLHLAILHGIACNQRLALQAPGQPDAVRNKNFLFGFDTSRREYTMKTLLRGGLLFVLLLAGSYAANAQVSVGIRIFAPPAPRVVAVLPEQPAPDFVWIGGSRFPPTRRFYLPRLSC